MANLNLGDKAISFDLPGVDGNQHDLSGLADSKAVAVVFNCNHCPYAQAWEGRLISTQHDYADQGLAMVIISSNDANALPADGFDRMKKRAEAKGYPFPYLYDESQGVARAYGAERTPEIFLFDQDRRMRYHGALDDNYERPEDVKVGFFRDAVESILSGREVPVAETKPIGCTIKWKPSN